MKSIAVKGIGRNSASVLPIPVFTSVGKFMVGLPHSVFVFILSVVDFFFFHVDVRRNFCFFEFEFDAKNRSAFCLT